MGLFAATVFLAAFAAPAPSVNWVLQDSQSSSSIRTVQVALYENQSNEPVKYHFEGQILLTRRVWGNPSEKPPWTLAFVNLAEASIGVDVKGDVAVPAHTRFRYLAAIPRTTAFEVWADLDEVPTTLYRRDRVWDYQPTYSQEFTPLP